MVDLVRDTWLPIESAPMDGTPIIVRWDGEEWAPRAAYYRQSQGGWRGLTFDGDFGNWRPFHRAPTHWRTIR